MRPEPRTLYGRLYVPDPRDQQYPLRASRVAAMVHRERHWQSGHVSDQLDTPHCVGHAWSQFLRSAPVMERQGRRIPEPTDIYHLAQQMDEWPGEDYDGTSVRAGAKMLQAAGLISGYLWAQTIEDIRSHVLTRGPVVVGTDWFEGMSEPRLIGLGDSYVEPEGEYEGGHAYIINGYSRRRHAFRMINSWGTQWGERGRAWVEFEVMRYLIFSLNGEACSAVEVS